jgi:hypothetical protein
MVDGLTPSDMGLFLAHLNGRACGRVKAVNRVIPIVRAYYASGCG